MGGGEKNKYASIPGTSWWKNTSVGGPPEKKVPSGG